MSCWSQISPLGRKVDFGCKYSTLRQIVFCFYMTAFLDQELMAIQTSGPKDIGFFGTRNMGIVQQQLVETLSYAMVLTGNHIFASGSTGTNAAVIRGAMRAEKPDLLTVVLPQSLEKQPPESQELLKKVIVCDTLL